VGHRPPRPPQPDTGKTYADDAALAAVELRNEDSVFFHWPLNALADGSLPGHAAALQADWADWLAARYADDAALLAAWGPTWAGSRPGDSLTNPAMPIYGAWEFGADGPVLNPAEATRMGDFIGFLEETQRDGYQRRGDALRDAGFAGLRITTAWQAGGDAAHLANAWSDSALDAIDRHADVGGGQGGWAIVAGTVDPYTHFDHPGEGLLGMAASQAEDLPFFSTEWDVAAPDPFAAEGAPLVAFYGLGLQGWDAAFHFSASSFTWMGGWPYHTSYVSETPNTFGLSPALATAVHEGHLATGPLAAAQRMTLDAVLSGVDPRAHPPVGSGFDGGDSLVVPPAVTLRGRVSHAIDAGPPEVADWGALDSVITSLDGALSWDIPGRFTLVQAEKTQGVIGFGGGRTHTLPDATVTLETDYATVLLTALDGRPLAESARVLITAVARDRESGAAYSADDTSLLSVGGPPLLLEPVVGTITLPGVTAVTALDVDGWPRVAVPITDDTFAIDGRWRTCWYLAERPAPADTGAPGAGGGADKASNAGCGCSTAPAPAGSLVALGMLWAWALRRRPALRRG
jgi:MYXO-CTERM domain-containing protein